MKNSWRQPIAQCAATALSLALVAAASSPARAQVCANPHAPADMAMFADVNGDLELDVGDALCTLLVNRWSQSPTVVPEPACYSGHWLRADINCSGDVDVSDVVLSITTIIVGLPAAFDANADACPDTCAMCAGSMADSCFSATTCYGVGAPNPGDPCEVCSAGMQVGEWTARPDGTSCGAGLVCVAGVCGAFVPGAPTSLVVQTNPALGILVSFDPPAFSGSTPIVSYTAECTSSNGGAPAQATSASQPVVVSGATYDAQYTCIAYATNSVGSGPATPPSAPFTFRPARRTCQHHFAAGEADSGVYLIDPDANGPLEPFSALCDMETDGGGWTLYASGTSFYSPPVDIVLNPAANDQGVLRSDRLTALVGQSSKLFRISNTGLTQSFYISDPTPLRESPGGFSGYGYGHGWGTNSSSVLCATSYAAVTGNTMATANTFAVDCDAKAIGSHTCGFGNGWILFHSGGTYNVSGGHPCSFGAGQSTGLIARWVR